MKNFLLFTLILNLSFSQEKDIFVTANERYNAGDFSLAIEKYHEILINGNHSSDLYFNLGNAYYKVDSLASAIYYYEKGLRANKIGIPCGKWDNYQIYEIGVEAYYKKNISK